MALGWTTALTQEVSEPFMRTGTMHIFAISGLHIALIAGILVALLRVLQIPRAVCGWLVIPLIWSYTAATGWQPSAIRSTLMMSVIIVGWALRRPSDLLNSLAAAGFIILLWDPQQLFQASFQLSFFVVLSIALLLPPIEYIRRRLLQTDPLLPPELRPRWRRRLERPIHAVTTAFATSLAAWLGSLPLIAHYFHLLTPVSLLANTAFAQWRHHRDDTRITVLPLSGGDSIYVNAPGRASDGLIDCGNESAARFIVKPFLAGQGVNRLPHLLLTHGDLRHIGGANLVGKEFSTGQFLASGVPFRSPTYRRILDGLNSSPQRLRQVNRGDQFG